MLVSIFGVTMPYQFYPEYYIIKVNHFNDVAKDSLDEWIYYLKNNRLPEHYSAPGLKKAAKILNYNNMDATAKASYDAHQKEMAISYGVLETAKWEGRAEGREEGVEIGLAKGREEGVEIGLVKGREEGREEGVELGQEAKTIAVVINAHQQGIPIPTISLIAEISEEEVLRILREQGLVE